MSEHDIEIDGITFTVEILSRPKPAYLSGRPEDCYEADPAEWDMVRAFVQEELPAKAAEILCDHYQERIEEKVQEIANED